MIRPRRSVYTITSMIVVAKTNIISIMIRMFMTGDRYKGGGFQ